MNAYFVKPYSAAEWGILVVTTTARRARALGYRAFCELTGKWDIEYIQVSAKKLTIVPPDDIAHEDWRDDEHVYDSCIEHWQCAAWHSTRLRAILESVSKTTPVMWSLSSVLAEAKREKI